MERLGGILGSLAPLVFLPRWGGLGEAIPVHPVGKRRQVKEKRKKKA